MSSPDHVDADQLRSLTHTIQRGGTAPAPGGPSHVQRRLSVSGLSRQQAKRCPTCHGSGRLPVEGDSELMALIPYRDQRLKPRRTKLKVAIAVFLVLITCFLLVFFLYPRAPTVSINAATVSHNVTKPDCFQIVLEINCTVHNNNFFYLNVNHLNIVIEQVSAILGQDLVKLDKSIASHSSLRLRRKVSGVISGDQGRHVVQTCEISRSAKVFLQLNVQLVTTFLSNTGQWNSAVPHFFNCQNNQVS